MFARGSGLGLSQGGSSAFALSDDVDIDFGDMDPAEIALNLQAFGGDSKQKQEPKQSSGDDAKSAATAKAETKQVSKEQQQQDSKNAATSANGSQAAKQESVAQPDKPVDKKPETLPQQQAPASNANGVKPLSELADRVKLPAVQADLKHNPAYDKDLPPGSVSAVSSSSSTPASGSEPANTNGTEGKHQQKSSDDAKQTGTDGEKPKKEPKANPEEQEVTSAESGERMDALEALFDRMRSVRHEARGVQVSDEERRRRAEAAVLAMMSAMGLDEEDPEASSDQEAAT